MSRKYCITIENDLKKMSTNNFISWIVTNRVKSDLTNQKKKNR